jgi:hypothetical protein
MAGRGGASTGDFPQKSSDLFSSPKSFLEKVGTSTKLKRGRGFVLGRNCEKTFPCHAKEKFSRKVETFPALAVNALFAAAFHIAKSRLLQPDQGKSR